ncbi:transmembrane protein, putative [Bodo saltans]|uniref:Transmembrane protein, putative n=1 Tax=Bodo saltans TaxID=75058 RepID=A0A0S4IS21_BODSA|nr:transmembrane protein, putative [Bodo saltans]|eukprot:CUF50140.1 transmembrane protein, putative [Bodo saltans]
MTNVVVVVPCPGQAQSLASEVKAASSVAQYSTIFSRAAAGAAVGRMASVRSLLVCSESSAIVEGMLPLSVNDCDDMGDAQVSDARGGIVGSLIWWSAGCALGIVAVTVYARTSHLSLRIAAEALGVPSPLIPLMVATIPSTVSSTTYLLYSSSRCVSDIVIAVVGVVMCVTPIAATLLASCKVPRLLTLVSISVQRMSLPTQQHGAARSFSRASAFLSVLFERQAKWCVTKTNNGDRVHHGVAVVTNART